MQAIGIKKKGRSVETLSLVNENHVSRFLQRNGYTTSEAEKLSTRIVNQVFAKFVKRHPGEAAYDRPSDFLHGISKDVLALLDEAEVWSVLNTTVVHAMTSENGNTTKLLVALADGHEVECVILRHLKRRTICVSSQVGCKMGCTFCATGALGYEYNLFSGEILQQLIHANRFLQEESKQALGIFFTNIVFMGMGEPLNNYSSVVQAFSSLVDVKRFNLSAARISISTVGVVNRMKTFHDDMPGACLALSLHAPNQELRQKIIPTATAYPLEKIMNAVKQYLLEDEDKAVMIEYILLAGVNDTAEIARELAELLRPIKHRMKVNLIPYNPIFNPKGLAVTFIPPKLEAIETFKNILQKDNGIFCTVRTEMGQDVNGACGQLACVSQRSKSSGVDIEDLYQRQTRATDSAPPTNRKLAVLHEFTTNTFVTIPLILSISVAFGYAAHRLLAARHATVA